MRRATTGDRSSRARRRSVCAVVSRTHAVSSAVIHGDGAGGVDEDDEDDDEGDVDGEEDEGDAVPVFVDWPGTIDRALFGLASSIDRHHGPNDLLDVRPDALDRERCNLLPWHGPATCLETRWNPRRSPRCLDDRVLPVLMDARHRRRDLVALAVGLIGRHDRPARYVSPPENRSGARSSTPHAW